MIFNLNEREAEQVLAYAFRVTDQPPAVSQFEIDADRVRGFVDRWLDRNHARCIRLDDSHADPDAAERAIARVRKDINARLARLASRRRAHQAAATRS